MQRQLYLAAYDVRCKKRLRLALKVCRAFASGGQKSAHECWLTPPERALLLHNMRLVIDEDEDQFALIALDPRRPVATLGTAVPPANPEFFYFA